MRFAEHKAVSVSVSVYEKIRYASDRPYPSTLRKAFDMTGNLQYDESYYLIHFVRNPPYYSCKHELEGGSTEMRDISH